MAKKGKASGMKQNGGVTGYAPASKSIQYPVTATSPASDVRKPSAVHSDFKSATKMSKTG